ncbi:MAG: flagellar basal body rod protein FlgC [Deltaproteobacteria bacterium]|nr:flagellar basal body rod protein FlgC [Deltaproteobacteria bacterium]
MLGVFSAMEISASGLTAERVRMNTIASNVANANTTRTAGGGTYRRIDPVFEAELVRTQAGVPDPGAGAVGASLVRVARIVEDPRDGRLVYEPGHPDANPEGYVEYPNVNVVEEMVNMLTASRAYEAGVTSLESVKAMAKSAIEIGR